MATFNTPYDMNVDFQGGTDTEPIVTFQDASGKNVLKSEIDTYLTWIDSQIVIVAPPVLP